MIQRTFFGLMVLAAGLLLRGAAADVLVAQPASSPTNYSLWTSNFGSNAPNPNFTYRGYDDFRAAAESRVTAVRWTGTIHDLDRRTNNPPALRGDETWRIAFYEDEDGLPGSLLSEQLVENNGLTSTLVAAGIPFLNYRVDLREWTAPLRFPVRLRATRRYWISIQLRTATANPLFSWLSSRRTGAGGYQYSYQNRALTPLSSELAFTLEGLPDTGSGLAPRLSVLPADNGLTLSWPDPDRSFDLESSPDLRPDATWSRVDADPAGADGRRVLVIPRPADRPREFFRLTEGH